MLTPGQSRRLSSILGDTMKYSFVVWLNFLFNAIFSGFLILSSVKVIVLDGSLSAYCRAVILSPLILTSKRSNFAIHLPDYYYLIIMILLTVIVLKNLEVAFKLTSNNFIIKTLPNAKVFNEVAVIILGISFCLFHDLNIFIFYPALNLFYIIFIMRSFNTDLTPRWKTAPRLQVSIVLGSCWVGMLFVVIACVF